MKFYVMRFYMQRKDTGEVEDKYGVYVYSDRTAAMKQYYKLLSADIDDASKLYSLCVVLDDNGQTIAKERFDHT